MAGEHDHSYATTAHRRGWPPVTVAGKGFAPATAAFAIWGAFPLYFSLLNRVSAVQVIAHRVVWSCLFVLVWVALRGELATLRATLRNPGGAARSETDATHGLHIHLIGAGNSAGQAALFFANHARSVTLVVRGDSLDESISNYLIEQVRGQANIVVLLRSEIRAVHGEGYLAAIDSEDLNTSAHSRHDCGGLFVFIGADADTGWLPPEIARDARGYVLTGDDVVRAGRWPEDRDPYLLEASTPGVFACGDVQVLVHPAGQHVHRDA